MLPENDEKHDGIGTVNQWLRAEDWYPLQLQQIIWFGDDGAGNFFGWDPEAKAALLWNPEDGAEPSKRGSLDEVWQFVLNGYRDIK